MIGHHARRVVLIADLLAAAVAVTAFALPHPPTAAAEGGAAGWPCPPPPETFDWATWAGTYYWQSVSVTLVPDVGCRHRGWS